MTTTPQPLDYGAGVGNGASILPGLWNHLLLTLRLNLRSKQAFVYGYIVPIFFLIAFGSLFKTEPPLVRELGQLFTITVLGGACFGLPTAMVSERERGVWRRYRLLPSAIGGLIVSTMVARYLIVASAAVIQVLLAHWLYKMPWPTHPVQLAIAFTFVCFAFLGLGLVIAMLAETVAAVQALGQAIFLPMIIIGGVGVPLRVLPAWAQVVAGFLPGRYAVDAMQACINPTEWRGAHGLPDVAFDLLALVVIGVAALITGSRLFRWDMNQRVARGAPAWIGAALSAWIVVGLVAWHWGMLKPVNERPNALIASVLNSGNPKPVVPPTPPAVPETNPHTQPLPPATGPAAPATGPTSQPASTWETITDADINGIDYSDLESYPDQGDVTPLAPSVDSLDDDRKQRLDDFTNKLDDWDPGKAKDPVQRVRNLLSAASTADVLQDPIESYIPFVIFQTLKAEFPKEQLEKILTCIILHPDDGTVVTTAPDLGLEAGTNEQEVRGRTVIYAKKLLARLVGKVLDK